MIKDKRAQFFAGVALVCFVLVPLAQDPYREYTFIVAITYMALASALDHHSRHRYLVPRPAASISRRRFGRLLGLRVRSPGPQTNDAGARHG